MLIVWIILAIVNVGVVWSIFNIKAHIEKQTTIQVSQLRLLAKIAKNTGSDNDEVNKVLREFEKNL